MRITCGGRMQRFSGREPRRMATKAKRDSAAATIPAFGEADESAAAQILRLSPEASQWTEWGLRELLGWSGVVALVSEDDGKVSGFIVGRQTAGETEILNLSLISAKRRRGGGGALLQAAMSGFRTWDGSAACL